MAQPLATIEKQNWKQLASVQVGGAICLPLLLVGYELAKQGTPTSILLSVFWGNLLLFMLALIAGFMSTKRNLTTVEHASFYFGPKGRLFFALILSSSMLGWFAIQTQCMGGDLYYFIQQFQENVGTYTESWKTTLSFVLAALMIVGAFWGLQFFTWMSHICIPLMLATIGYAIYHTGALSWIREISFDGIAANVWNGKGVSLVLASSMAATIDLPTFYRHADNQHAPVIASITNYLIAMPLVQIGGMCLYYGTQAPTISEALATQSSLPWKAWVLCFMLLAGWTTNNLNLYSAALSFKSLYKNMRFSTAMGIIGMAGCFLVFIPVLEKFTLALDLMGIFVVAMGGVMFVAYLLEEYAIKIKFYFIWIAWFAGIFAGLNALIWPSWGSGAPVLDAGLIAMLTLFLIQLLDNFFKNKQQALMEKIG